MEPGNPVPLELVEALKAVLGGVSDPDGVLRALLDEAVRRSGAERGLLVQVGAGGELDYTILHRFSPGDVSGAAGEFSRSLFAEVLRTERGILLENAMQSPIAGASSSVRAMRLVSVLCVPVRAEGRVAGIVHLEHGSPGRFRDRERRVIESLLEVAGPVLEALIAGRRALEERDRLREARENDEVEIAESRGILARDWSFGRFVGRSPAVRDLGEAVRRAADSPWPVLILGETGTGKGIVARILHYASPRASKPFVTVFCPNLERGLVESELFGHRRCAFTGADQDRAGKVQAAEGGTLFLDEVGDLPLELQPRLLRLLQERTYERLGDPIERRADVRVVAATNRDLEEEVAAGRFRRDLYERLNFVPIRIPPLRDRRTDIPLLLRDALDRTGAGRWLEMDPDAEGWLAGLDHVWPGNVRQLEQIAARLALASPSGPVRRDDLARAMGTEARASGIPPDGVDLDAGLPASLERYEREWLSRALRHHAGLTRKELADRLRISDPTLYKKLRQHGLGGKA